MQPEVSSNIKEEGVGIFKRIRLFRNPINAGSKKKPYRTKVTIFLLGVYDLVHLYVEAL